MMYIEYILDQGGRLTGVIIPINLCTKIGHPAEEDQKDNGAWNPSQYMGMYKNLNVDVKKESKALRDEWTGSRRIILWIPVF